jgi:hypothetical protein
MTSFWCHTTKTSDFGYGPPVEYSSCIIQQLSIEHIIAACHTVLNGNFQKRLVPCLWPTLTPCSIQLDLNNNKLAGQHLWLHQRSGSAQRLNGGLKCRWLQCFSKATFRTPGYLRTHLINFHVNPLLCTQPVHTNLLYIDSTWFYLLLTAFLLKNTARLHEITLLLLNVPTRKTATLSSRPSYQGSDLYILLAHHLLL